MARQVYTYAEMSARHAVALEVLAGFVATATEGAFQRLMRAELPADRDQAALVFDRMGWGLRLTVALEVTTPQPVSSRFSPQVKDRDP